MRTVRKKGLQVAAGGTVKKTAKATTAVDGEDGTLATTTRASARSAKNLFDRDAMAHNLNAVDGCRSYLTLFGAVGAGVVGASTYVEINQCVGCSSSAMTRPIWLGRAARNRHRHAIEQA